MFYNLRSNAERFVIELPLPLPEKKFDSNSGYLLPLWRCRRRFCLFLLYPEPSSFGKRQRTRSAEEPTEFFRHQLRRKPQ